MVKTIKYCAISLDNLNLRLSEKAIELLKSLATIGLFSEISDNEFETNSIDESGSLFFVKLENKIRSNQQENDPNPAMVFAKGISVPSDSLPSPPLSLKLIKSNSNSESNLISSVLISTLGDFRTQISSSRLSDDMFFLTHLVTILIQRYERELRLIETIERSEDLNPVRYDLAGLIGAVKVNRKSKEKLADYKIQFERDVLALAQDWFDWIEKAKPYRVRKFGVDHFAEGILLTMKHTNLNIVGMREVFKFLKTDDFYSKLHLQPGGLLRTSKNGYTKIDNILGFIKSKMSKDNPWEVIDSGEWENPFI